MFRGDALVMDADLFDNSPVNIWAVPRSGNSIALETVHSKEYVPDLHKTEIHLR